MKITKQELVKFLEQANIPFREYSNNTIQICNPIANQYPPYEEDTKFHMGLNYDKQAFHCFKTNISGKLTKIIRDICKIKGVSFHKKEAYDLNNVKSVKEDAIRVVSQEKEVKLPKEAFKYDSNSTSVSSALFKNYLSKRKIDVDIIRNAGFYYCVSGMYEMRLIIPYYINEKLVYWTARDITNKKKEKYLYAPGSEKSNWIYNYDNCNRENLILTEGQLNTLVISGVALGGTTMSQEQVKLILSLKPKTITVALDQDVPGKSAVGDICRKLKNYFSEIYYLDVPITTKEDFCDIGYKEASEWLCEYTKKYSLLNDLETKIKTLL